MAREIQDRPHIQPKSRVRDPDKFAKALHAAGYTYRSLADHFHMARTTLNDYGLGKLRVLPAFAADIEEALSVETGSLFTPAASATPNKPSAEPTTPSNPSGGQG